MLLCGLVASFGCKTDEDPDTETPQVFEQCQEEFTTTAPNPLYAWTPNAITLISEEVAPGVFAVYDKDADTHGPAGIPAATSSGFVIGEEGVLLVDTMVNRRLLCQLVDLVQAETDKPVLYAINTSYHGDHSYGNAYLPEEVKIVQHTRTAEVIAQHFEEDVAFMEANFGADQGIGEAVAITPDVRVTDDGWSVDLGGKTVEARYFGFGQTEGDLFVSVPGDGVLWTGNPLISEQPSIPWLLDGQAEAVSATLSAVQSSMPAGSVVIPGHGRPVTVDGFNFSINYLNTLRDEVQTAVDGGLSQEETVSAVTMEEFQGYALWGWIHDTVNVPVTYAEMSE